MTQRIEDKATQTGAWIAGRIRYDRSVTMAQMQQRAVVQLDSHAAADVRRLWETLEHKIGPQMQSDRTAARRDWGKRRIEL
jgi:hypothetical protein